MRGKRNNEEQMSINVVLTLVVATVIMRLVGHVACMR
jgi:hypothetical protein